MDSFSRAYSTSSLQISIALLHVVLRVDYALISHCYAHYRYVAEITCNNAKSTLFDNAKSEK